MAKHISVGTAKVSGDISAALAAERLRIGAILESEEGLIRPKLARELALRSNIPADQARDILASTPPDSPFHAAMDREGHIGIPANGGSPYGVENARDTRMREIAESARHFNLVKGYTAPNRKATA